jgi:MFS family permease
VLAVALLGHAALAMVLVRDRPAPAQRRVHARRAVADLLRLPATRHLSAWYAVTFGGLVAAGLYLPAYLHHTHQVPERISTLYTAACVTVAAACRPLGGRLCQRFNPVRLLRATFTITAGVTLALAFQPDLPAAAAMIAAIAVCLGVGSGSVQALLGATVPPEQAGTIAGTVGAIGGLAGVLPPLLLATTRGVTGSYGIGLTMLAAVTAMAAWYLHTRHRWISAALAFPETIALPRVISTAVVVTPNLHDGAALTRTVGVLIGMATRHEVVVIAANSHDTALVDGLRLHLPRHRVVTIATGERPHPHETNLVAELLNDGALPVVVAMSGDPEPVALLVATALGTGHVLRIPTSARCLPTP